MHFLCSKLISLKLIGLRTTRPKVTSLLKCHLVEIRLYAPIHEAATTIAIYNRSETVDNLWWVAYSIFAPVRGLVQFVSSVVSLRGRCCFQLPYGTVIVVVVVVVVLGEEGEGGTPVTSVQFPAQLRDFHNKKAIASPKQSHGAI